MMVVEGNSRRITIEYTCPFCRETKREDYNTDEFTLVRIRDACAGCVSAGNRSKKRNPYQRHLP